MTTTALLETRERSVIGYEKNHPGEKRVNQESVLPGDLVRAMRTTKARLLLLLVVAVAVVTKDVENAIATANESRAALVENEREQNKIPKKMIRNQPSIAKNPAPLQKNLPLKRQPRNYVNKNNKKPGA